MQGARVDEEISWRAAAQVAALALATLVLRVPLLSPRLAHWDAVNYALGLHHFDIAAHQPHPPGSPYFILIGRLALGLAGDDNLALQLVSLVASVGAVVAEYVLARKLFGPAAAILAALVLMTQPIFWGYGTTATAWTLLAFLSIVITLTCLLLIHGVRQLTYPSALLMGIVSGFRADAAVFLGPLWLWSLMRATSAWRERVIAVGVACVSGLVWLVPVVTSAGGLSTWSSRLLALLPSGDSSLVAIIRQIAANTVISFGTLALVIGLPLVLAVMVGRARLPGWWRETIHSEMAVFWALAILPAFIFLWLIDSTEPGHDLIFIGALVALGAGVVARCASTRAQLTACAAVLLVGQTYLFLFAAPFYDRPLAWTLDSMLLNVTAGGLRQQQSSLDATLTSIRDRFDPRTTAVVTLVGQDPYRFMMYYLPEFKVVRLDTGTHAVLVAHDRQQGNWTEADACRQADSQVRAIVWVLSRPTEPGTIPANARLLLGGDADGPLQVWYRDTTAAAGLEYLGFDFGCSQLLGAADRQSARSQVVPEGSSTRQAAGRSAG